MSRTPRPHDDERERNLPGMPPAEDRQRPGAPGAPDRRRTAWSRGDGGMEGPAGWHSEFGRAGFAGKGERLTDPPEPRNPLDDAEHAPPAAAAPAAEQKPARKPENRVEQGEATDSWDRPYGDASWGGQAVRSTPEEDKAANAPAKTPKGRKR